MLTEGVPPCNAENSTVIAIIRALYSVTAVTAFCQFRCKSAADNIWTLCVDRTVKV